MTSHSDSAGTPEAQPTKHWRGLQSKIRKRKSTDLSAWIESDLEELEAEFAWMETKDSRKRYLSGQAGDR